MIENVRGILDAVFCDYRLYVEKQFTRLGYRCDWYLLNACDFGVPQLRPRVVFIALRQDVFENFSWPTGDFGLAPPVGEVLCDLMAANRVERGQTMEGKRERDCPDSSRWVALNMEGPDLGPTRARKAWATLNVDGLGIGNEAPAPATLLGMPRLTVRMVARLQGFPDSWQFSGGKTAAYRQVGNAFPPPVARAMAERIGHLFISSDTHSERPPDEDEGRGLGARSKAPQPLS